MKTVSKFEKWTEGYVLACQIKNDRDSKFLAGVLKADTEVMNMISEFESKHYTDDEILRYLYSDCSCIYSEYSPLLWDAYSAEGYYVYYGNAVNYFESEVDER